MARVAQKTSGTREEFLKRIFLLASQSPQRREILTRIGVAFEVIPPDFDETMIKEKDPVSRARILAEKKAHSVSILHSDRLVIGADTLVVSADGELLEKPCNSSDAERMLRLQSGRTSLVHSAVCLMRDQESDIRHSTAGVTFRSLTDRDIAWWINTGLWEDRSGAFQIEGEGQKLIAGFTGEFETVVGFPVGVFREMCEKIGA